MDRIVIAGILILFGLGAVTEGEAQEVHVPESVAIFPSRVPEWQRGYRDGYGNERKPDSSVMAPYYFQGYNAGYWRSKQDREKEAKERHERALFERYGTQKLVDWWERGFASKESKPPDEQDPSPYLAYMEGFHAGQQARAEGREKAEVCPNSARAEEARSLAELFVKQLDGMRLQSDKYYLLLEATRAQFQLAADAEVPLTESSARTKLALERAKETYKTHLLFNQHAYLASRIHPRLVAAVEARAAGLLADIKRTEFGEFRRELHMKADKVAALARRLAAEPVTVPGNFEAMGRYHRESIVVMGKALDADLLRETLAAGQLDTDGLRVGMADYVKFCRSWQEGQLSEWRADRLQRLYRSLGNEPPTGLAAEARRQAEPFFTPARPGSAGVVMTLAPSRATTASTPSSPSPATPLPDEVESLGLLGWLKRICLWVGCFVVGVIALAILASVFN